MSFKIIPVGEILAKIKNTNIFNNRINENLWKLKKNYIEY